MSQYEIVMLEPVEKELAKLRDKKLLMRLIDAIDALQENPRPHGCKPLKGTHKGKYRIRVGEWRIIYQIEDQKLIIAIIWVGDRKDVYR